MLRGRIADVRAAVARAWAHGGRRQRAWLGAGLVLAAALAGAFLFGAWHVVFGGFVKGNWRAGAFGVALAVGAGAALRVEAAVWQRTGR